MKEFSVKWIVIIVSCLVLGQNMACKQDNPEPKPQPEPAVTADFSFAFNTSDLRIVTFTSKAENYKTGL